MGNGTGTTAILHPSEGSAITFDMAVSTSEEAGYGYVMDAGSLRVNLRDRRELRYSEGSARDGGDVANDRGKLVDVSFDVVVTGRTRAEMLEQVSALETAMGLVGGGTFEWKPDDLGAGVRSTYFCYLTSPVPSLKARSGNRFDAAPSGTGTNVRYRVTLEVTLRTQPWSKSDPDTPVTVLTSTTLENADDASRDNYATVLSSSIVGDKPSLARVTITPQTSGGDIGRVIVSRRTEGLTNFQAMYRTASYLSPTAGWSAPSDAARVGGAYYKCTPSQNDVAYGLRYTIANWADHQGTAAIAVIYKAFGEHPDDDWEIHAAWSIADTPFTGEAKSIQELYAWRLLILSEIDIPETEMSAIEDLDLYIDIYVTRTAGTGSIGVDAISLVFTDESVVEAAPLGDEGASTSHDMIIENFDGELAHIVTTADDKLQYVMNPLGTPGLIKLKPGVNNRLDVLWERAVAGLEDDFDGYGAYWKRIGSFETSEDWAGAKYTRFCAVRWRITEGVNAYPVDIADGSLDTASLVSAGKMASDGDDLRVLVDGEEVDRWLGNMNTASTGVWIALPFEDDISMTLNGAITATVTSLTVTGTITSLSSYGIIQIGNEIIHYSGKSGQDLTGLTRGYKGTTAAAHNDTDDVYWLQHDVEIVYGNPDASAPTLDSDYKPSFDVDDSSNTLWKYTTFAHGVNPTHNMGMEAGWDSPVYPDDDFLEQITSAGNNSWYNWNHDGSGSGDEAEIGLEVISITGPNNGGTIRVAWHNECGIVAAEFIDGEKYSESTPNWDAEVESSINGSSWTTEYTIPAPGSASTWESWSHDDDSLPANTTWIATYLSTIYTGGTHYQKLEYDALELTFDSNNVPTVNDFGERSGDSIFVVEGGQNLAVYDLENTGMSTQILEGAFVFPFPTTAFVCIYIRMVVETGCTAQSLRLRLYTDASNYYTKTWSYSESAGAMYDKYEEALLSGFSTTGSPDLNDIQEVELYATGTNGGVVFYVDDLRVVAADPGDAGAHNDTGAVWDFESGTWHIYELDGSDKYLGQIETASGIEKIALIHTNYGADVTFSAKCRAKRDEGLVGLVFRCSDATGGSEDCYAFLMDTENDELLLREYVAGTPSNVATAVSYTLAIDTDYYLGIKVQGSTIQCFISTAKSTLFVATNRKFNTTDSTHSTGQCGLLTASTIGRFTDVDLDGIQDRHVPADQVNIVVQAIFQTAMPFYE